LCVAIFAPRIFAAQMRELASLSFGDFWGPNSAKYVVYLVVGGAWLYFTEGNMLLAGAAYYGYKKLIKDPQQQLEAARAAKPPAVTGGQAQTARYQAAD